MQTWKLNLACGVFLAFVISGCEALDELRYGVWGRRATADVSESYVTRDPGSRSGRKVRVVSFSFRDGDGPVQSGTDMVHPESPIQAGQKVDVQYLPGDERRMRLEGNRRLLPVAFFLGCLVVLVGFVGMLVREANEPVRRHRRA